VHLLILLLQHLLGQLLNKPQLQPETVRPNRQGGQGRQGASVDEPAECRGYLFDSFGWLTVLFAAAPVWAPFASRSFVHSRAEQLCARAYRCGGGTSHTSSFLSFARRTSRCSPRLRR
jgi:hypothetical protein